MKGGIHMDELYTAKEVSKILKVNVHSDSTEAMEADGFNSE